MTAVAPHDLRQSWDRIAMRLKAELGDDLYSSWFARMEPEQWADGRLAVTVPTRFLRNWIETHYQAKLLKASAAELGGVESVLVKVRTHAAPPRQRDVPERPATDASHQAQAPASERSAPLDQNQTFATYIHGRSNALAHAAAMRVADAAPGAALGFNPLFIHSAAGLGKTHLLNAIAWRIRQANPERKVMMLTAERFMVNFVQALRSRDTISFKDAFAGVDVLLIDDFQFLQGKTMQQEFCYTFNALVDARRQVVVAADVPPAQLDAIDQRMRSRLVGGLVIDIEMPDIDLRRAMLALRIAALAQREPGFLLGDDVTEFIANKISGGGREIEGALNRIAAWQQFNTGQAITLDLAAMILRDMSQAPDMNRVKIDDILKIVGRHYNVARADLLSPRRARSIVVPRQIGMYLAKKMTPRSLPEIGRRFGDRDHSTVLHAVRKIEELVKTDDRMARDVALLTRLVEQGG